MGRKRPPQGAQSMHNPEKRESMIEYGADKILSEIDAFLWVLREHKDNAHVKNILQLKAEGMLSDQRAGTHLAGMQDDGIERQVVALFYKHVKYGHWADFTKYLQS